MAQCGPFVVSRVRREKVITYVTPQGRSVRVTREVYLRDNIPCRSHLCTNDHCRLGNDFFKFCNNIF